MIYGTYERSVQAVETRGAMLERSFHWSFVVTTTYSRTFSGGNIFWYQIFSDPVGFECFSRHGFSHVGSVDGTVPRLSTGPLCLYLQLHQIPHLYHVFPFYKPEINQFPKGTMYCAGMGMGMEMEMSLTDWRCTLSGSPSLRPPILKLALQPVSGWHRLRLYTRSARFSLLEYLARIQY